MYYYKKRPKPLTNRRYGNETSSQNSILYYSKGELFLNKTIFSYYCQEYELQYAYIHIIMSVYAI